MFGKGLSFTKRWTNEIPGPQTEHRRQGMFVKSTLCAQLECSRIRMLHTVNAPALSRPQRVAESSGFCCNHRMKRLAFCRPACHPEGGKMVYTRPAALVGA